MLLHGGVCKGRRARLTEEHFAFLQLDHAKALAFKDLCILPKAVLRFYRHQACNHWPVHVEVVAELHYFEGEGLDVSHNLSTESGLQMRQLGAPNLP